MDTQKSFKRVGTHHGRFHADEVMATAILKGIFELEVIRTRDIETLNKMDFIYDVGGGEFDHHQIEKTYRDNGIPYAACGLIWKKYGKDVIKYQDSSLEEEDVDSVFRYVDTALVEGIDALDNGIRTGDMVIKTMNISAIISGFNPTWDSDIQEDSAFNEAVGFASVVLENILRQKLSVIRARGNVTRAYNNRTKREVLVLDILCPWGQTIDEIDVNEEILFVVHPGREGYVIHTVRKQSVSQKTRKDLPKSWAGKRDDELGKIAGVSDAIFCHSGRFMAVAGSYNSALKMADMAVGEPPDGMMQRFLWRFKKLLSQR